MKLKTKDLLYYLTLTFFVLLPFLVNLFTSSGTNKKNDIEVFVGEPVTVTPAIVISNEATVGSVVEGRVTLNASDAVKINGAILGILIPKNLEVSEVKIGEKLDNYISETAALKFTKDYNPSYHLIQYVYLNNPGVVIPNTPVTIFTFKLKGTTKGVYELTFNTSIKPEIKGLTSAARYSEYYVAGIKQNIEFKDATVVPPDTTSPTCGDWTIESTNEPKKIKITARASDSGSGLVRGGLYISSKPNTNSADFGAIPNDYTFGPQKEGIQNYTWDTSNLAPGKYAVASNWWDNSGKPNSSTNDKPGGHLGNFVQCRTEYTVEAVPPVVDRPDYCKSISLSTAETDKELKEGETLTLKSVPKTDKIKKFSFAFYNKDNLTTGQNPTPKGIMYEAGKQFYSSFVPMPNEPVYIGSTQVSYADLYKPDTNWSNKIPQNIQVNAYFTDSDNKVSAADPVCVASFTLKPKVVPPVTHLECVNSACTQRDGVGDNTGGCTTAGAACASVTPPTINYGVVKDLTSVIRLDKRTNQEGIVSTIGHAHPNIYVGLWRPSTNKMLTQALTKTAADGNLSIPNFFSKNGINNDVGYVLEKTDLIIIKPESYLSQAFEIQKGVMSTDGKSIQVKDLTKPYLGGDLLIDIGSFDVVNIRDYVLMRNYYGSPSGQKQDQYYLDYNGNGYIDVRDFALYNTNLGKKGTTETLNRGVIDILTDFVKTSLYQVILRP